MSMKEWIFNKYDGQEKSLIKRLLHSRGIKSDEDIYEFTHPLETKITHPKAFTDMEKVIERLSNAIVPPAFRSAVYPSSLIYAPQLP